MITSITRIDRRRRGRFAWPAGYSLVELLIGLTLSGFVLVGVFSAFLMFGRSSMNAANYSIAEAEIRRAIDEFSRDVRMAKAIRWNGSTSITLTVPDNYATSGNQVTYGYDGSTTGATARSFYRMPGGTSSSGPQTVFVREVSSFSFARFNRANNTASTDAETKRIQITMNVRRTRNTLVAANTTVVSASYTLRNKAIN